MSETEFIHVAIDKDLKKKAVQEAEKDNRSLSNWIRGIIRKAVNGHERQ